MSRRIYRIKLDIDGTTHDLLGGLPENAKLTYSKDGGQIFLRAKLSGKWNFLRDDYELIHAAAYDANFTITVEYSDDRGTTWAELEWKGEFWKTDCKFDTDNKRVEVQNVRSKDRYSKVIDALEKEFDLIALGPASEPVKYRKQPIIQLHVLNTDLIMNYISGSYWEEKFDRTGGSYGELEIQADYQFAPPSGGMKYFIPGGGDLNPDVSGIYSSYTSPLTREDGKYTIQEEDLGSGMQWTIRDQDAGGIVVYKAPPGEALTSSGEGEFTESNTPGTTFTSETDPASKCNVFYWRVYGRILTDKISDPTESPPLATVPVPDPDISQFSAGYTRIAHYNPDTWKVSDGHQTDNERYGKFADDALHFAGEFFKRMPPDSVSGVTQPFPINKTYWRTCSAWYWYDYDVKQKQEFLGEDATLRDAYQLHEVISVLLAEIDPSLTFQDDQAHSQFLYDATGNNPVSGEVQPRIFISPKSNFLVSEYDQPAQRAPVHLSDILTMLWAAYRLKWFIDDSNRFRLEHISWFEKGGSYTTETIGLDLTGTFEPKTGESWDYRTSRWSYAKQRMPEQILTKWMDEVSEPFRGWPIEMRSRLVDLGNFEEIRAGLFTSDLDFIRLQADSTSKEGFVLIAAFDVSGDWTVQFLEIEAPAGYDWKIQNGHLSFAYLHDRYHRHGLPTQDVRINDTDTTATTQARNRIQELQLPISPNFDTFALARATVEDTPRNGQLEEVEIDLESLTAKIKIAHDSE